MKIGAIARKIGLSLMCAILAIVPFSVPVVADYQVNYQQAFAYAFWALYGFDTLSPSTSFSGSINAYTISGSMTFQNTTTSDDSMLNVYSYSNGAWLGYYISASGQTVTYRTSSGATGTCTNCHIGFNISQDYYTNNVSLKVPAESISITESGSPYIPYLTQSSSFPTVTGYTNNMQQFFQNDIGTASDDSIVLSFIINKTVYQADSPVFYDRNLGDQGYIVSRPYNQNLGYGSSRMCLYTYEIKGVNEVQANNYFTVQFPSLEGQTGLKVLPIYFGAKNNLTEDLGKMIGIDVGVTYILDEGSPEAQASVGDNDQSTDVLNSSISDLVGQEDTFINSMDSDLQNVDFNAGNNILNESSLALSANWVKTQYDRMTSNNVIGDLISYALLFGLGLLIVGKSR